MLKYLIFLISVQFLFSFPSEAEDIYIGKKYSVAGKHTSGLCHLINDASCEERKSEIDALEAVTKGQVDLASVLSSRINPNNPLRVLMHLTSDHKFMLVTRRDLPEADANQIIQIIEDYLQSDRDRAQSKLIQELTKLPRNYGGRDPLEKFLKFEKTYPLHPSIANYYQLALEKPLKITYGTFECERGDNHCAGMSDVPVEDYRVSQKVAFMGMGIAPYLIKNLKSDNPYLVMKSAYALGHIWPHNPKILAKPLLGISNHSNSEVREQAVLALSSLEPTQPEVVKRLIEIANEKIVQRESFSDGSHGLSMQKTVLTQQPISQVAAYGLSRIGNKEAIDALKSLVKSPNKQKQAEGLRGLVDFLRRERHNLNKNKSREELKAIDNHFSVQMFTPQGREVLSFLKEQQKELFDENKKLVVDSLNQYEPGSVSDEVISNLINDLYSSRKECFQRRDKESVCHFKEMREALYKLSKIDTSTKKKTLLKGLKNVLRKGGPRELDIAYQLLSDLSKTEKFNDNLIELMVEKANEAQKERSFEALAITVANNPAWEEKIIVYFISYLNDDDEFTRIAAINGLTTLGNLSENHKSEIAKNVIEAIRKETNFPYLRYMIVELGKMAESNEEIRKELFYYGSYRQDILDDFYKGKKPARTPKVKTGSNQTYPPSPHDVYSIRIGALEAIEKLKTISKEELDIILRGYEKDLLHSQCDLNYLGFSLRVYNKHSTAKSDLVPTLKKALSRSDNSKCNLSILSNLESFGEDANSFLPILEEKLNQNDLRENRSIFRFVKSIETPEANEFLKKYEYLNSLNKNETLPKIINLLKVFEANFEIEPIIDSAEMHVIAVEHSLKPNENNEVTIEVDYPEKAILLMLYGLEEIKWTVKPLNKTKIIAARLGGRSLQIKGNIPDDIRVFGYIGNQDDYTKGGGITGEYAPAPLEKAKAWTGKEAKTFQYYRKASKITLNSETPAMPSFPLGTHLSKIFDENGDLIAQ